MAAIFMSKCIMIVFTAVIQVHGELYCSLNISLPLKTKSIPDELPLHFLVAVLEFVCCHITLGSAQQTWKHQDILHALRELRILEAI